MGENPNEDFSESLPESWKPDKVEEQKKIEAKLATEKENEADENIAHLWICIGVFVIILAFKYQSFILGGIGGGILLPSLKRYFKS